MRIAEIKNKKTKEEQDKFEECIKYLISYIGDDPNRSGLLETPKRVRKMYEEIFAGYEITKTKNFDIKMFEECDGLVKLKIKNVYSCCEHHMLPFFGEVLITYRSKNKKVIGLSKIPRLVHDISHKLQLQERMTEEIAQTLFDLMNPEWIEVLFKCEKHLCVSMRGAKSEMETESFVRIDKDGVHHKYE